MWAPKLMRTESTRLGSVRVQQRCGHRSDCCRRIRCWFELVSLRSCLLGSSSRSLLLHQIHKSIIRFALLLFGLPAQFLRASPGGILFQRSLRFSNAGKAGFTASELRWDVLFSLFNAQPLVFLLVDRARSLQQFFDLERQPLLLLGHPLVGHRLVLARVRLHLRAIECDVSEPHQTCFLAKLQDFEEERFQCLQVDQPKLVDRREVGMTFSSQHPEWNVLVGRPRDPPRRIDAGAVGVQKQRDHHSRRVRSLASRVLGLDRDLDRAQLYLIDDVQDEVREMIFWEPLERGRREQERLSRSPRTVLLRHEGSLLPDGTSLWHRKRRLTPHLLEAPTRQRAEGPSRQSQAQARCREAHAPHQVDERTPGCMIATGTGTGTGTGLA